MFDEKRYVNLPVVKYKYIEKLKSEGIGINYLKSKYITAETILNEAYLLGHSKGPSKEYRDLITNNRDKDLIEWHRITEDVKIFNLFSSI